MSKTQETVWADCGKSDVEKITFESLRMKATNAFAIRYTFWGD